MPRRPLIAAFLVLLFFLHQDSWLKDDPRLVFGVLPVSLAYHVGWTLLVALGWWLVAKFAWPAGLDEDAPAGPALSGGRDAPPARPRTGGPPVPATTPPSSPEPR